MSTLTSTLRTVRLKSILSSVICEGSTAATQSEVNTGTATTVYVNPATLQDRNDTAVALTDQATIDITGPKHTLATASSRTFTISHAGDDMIIEVTLSSTSATFTFPATALCVSEGTASGIILVLYLERQGINIL